MNRAGQVWHVKAGSYPGVFLVLRTGRRESGIYEHECLILDLDRSETKYLRPELFHTFYEDVRTHWDARYEPTEIEQIA